MNAQDKGRESGFAYKLTIIGGSKRHFEHVGKQSAQHAYKKPEKQAEFLQGWMDNWQDPHPTDCTCAECVSLRAIEVETY